MRKTPTTSFLALAIFWSNVVWASEPPITGVTPASCIQPPNKPVVHSGVTLPRSQASETQNLTLQCSQGVSLDSAKPAQAEPDHVADWLEFIRHIAEAIAWPLAALVIAGRLGPELKKKLPSLTKFKAGPVEAEFTKEVAALREEAELDTPIAAEVQAVSRDETRLIELAKVSARAAIIEAWRIVEADATRAVESRAQRRAGPYPAERPRNAFRLAKELGLLQILNAQEISLFNELRFLRNQAAHVDDFETSFESAHNYIQLTQSLRSAIERSIRDDRNSELSATQENR